MHPLSLEIGAVIDGKYRVEGTIGSGGMGVVFLARHLQLRERVAIKVLKPERGSRPELVERLLREARAAASIRNRHVVRVLDVGTLPDAQPFIVMEYLEGEDLATLLGRGASLSVRDAVDYAVEAGEAVAEAHALGIVHRDLKPANLFLERRASGAVSVKVLDFGVARFLTGHADATEAKSGLTNSHSFVGSPAYMSPEQLTSPDDVDTRADVWALGLILYEMLSGSQPFKAPTLAVTCTKILQQSVPPLARTDVAPELAQALERALEKDRERRFASVLELCAVLAPHGSPAARASLTEIEAVQKRDGSGTTRSASAKPNVEPGSPTLTGSVLRPQRTSSDLRARRFTLLGLGLGALVLGLVLWGKSSSHQASASNGERVAPSAAAAPAALAVPGSGQGAALVPPAAQATVTAPSAASRAVAQHPAARVPALPLTSAKRDPATPSAAAQPAPPASDDSDRLYEFRK